VSRAGNARSQTSEGSSAPGWDALIREHKSVVQTPLPLILGSDVSGVIEAVRPGVSAFQAGDDIYGVTNPDFCGAYTE